MAIIIMKDTINLWEDASTYLSEFSTSIWLVILRKNDFYSSQSIEIFSNNANKPSLKHLFAVVLSLLLFRHLSVFLIILMIL